MGHDIIFAPQAKNDLSTLKANIRSAVRDGIESHLRHAPTRASRSRIKRLRGLAHPQYRLRIGDVRVFYDVVQARVEILAVVKKSDADEWLRKVGKRDEGSSAL